MSGASDIRPTWADIDTRAYAGNIDTVAASLPAGSRLIAVLKANGYGHGAAELAKVCKPERVAMIAVALLEEALELRGAGIELPILVFGSLSEPQIVTALDNAITPGVVGPEELARACAVARDRDVAIHLKLDSGMGRMGVTEWELAEVAQMIRATPRLRIDAIYTHFANADEEGDPFTEQQIATFDCMLASLGIEAPLHHAANSAATLRGLVRPGDYARAGIVLYGPQPMKGIEPVMRWRTEIVRLKILPPGHAIGYGTTFRTQRQSRIATLPVGYADGYNRLLSNQGEVLLRGQRVPIVGRVSMDLVTIDVTDHEAALGDEVVLLGRQEGAIITAEEIAAKTQTISYEVFCSVGGRVPRFYR